MNKQEMRMEMLGKLQQLAPLKRAEYNRNLLQQLLNSTEWQKAQSVAVTLSRSPEVETGAVIQAAWKNSKKVVIPYSGPSRKLSFYHYDSGTELEESRFGLLEPAERDCPVLSEEIDLVIVPGLAYSSNGFRIGFGGGYYDRFLTGYPGATVSLLYPFQLCEEVSRLAEPFDIPVQKLFIAAD